MLGKYPEVDVDNVYFSENDCSSDEINAIISVTPLNLSQATKRRQALQRQLDFVTRKVSQIILDRQQSYAVELSRVLELEAALRQAREECHNARSHIGLAKSVFTVRGLYLLGNCRHRRQLLMLLKTLHQIRCVRGTGARLTSFLDANDYSAAIELGVGCQKEASSLSKFSCLRDTSAKLQDALQSVEETMDTALAKHCINFDPDGYDKLQAGYRLLGPGKLQVAADQLIMYAVNTLQDRCYSVLTGYAALTQQDSNSQHQHESFNTGRPFVDICKAFSVNMEPAIVIAGVRDCAEACWQILINYKHIYQWHNSFDSNSHPLDEEIDDAEQSLAVAENYVKTKLKLGHGRIWQEVDGRMRVLLTSLCMQQFSSENFLNLLEILRVLLDCGNWFASIESPGITESIVTLARRFFESFHSRSLEETKTFFENETWTICPLPRNFTIWDLKELENVSKTNQCEVLSGGIDFDQHFDVETSPFTSILSEKSDSPNRDRLSVVFGYGDDSGPSANSGNCDDPNQFAPVSNATFSVIRIMAQYVNLLQPMSSVAMDIIVGLASLYDQYLFSVFQTVRLLPSDAHLPTHLQTPTQRLTGTLHRIQEQHGNAIPYISPLSPILPNCSHRVLAAESVVFLGSQAENLRSTLEKHIPQQKSAFLTQFYSQSVKSAEEIRTLAYFPIGAHLLNSSSLIQLVMAVNFEPSDIQSQHSRYVDWIIHCIQEGTEKLAAAVNERGIPCPRSVNNLVVGAALRCATFYLLEGYSQVKRCKGEGRALMQLDVEQLSKAAERKLGSKPPLPGRDQLDNFIRAFYLRDETELEQWIRDHREFSPNQLHCLVAQLPWLTARAKKRLSELITTSTQLPVT